MPDNKEVNLVHLLFLSFSPQKWSFWKNLIRYSSFFRTFAREINRLEYQIAWNIKQAGISDRLEYVFKIRYKI